jgi:hypothetical protein
MRNNAMKAVFSGGMMQLLFCVKDRNRTTIFSDGYLPVPTDG